MRVLAKDPRPVRVGPVGVLLQFLRRGVHPGDDVRVRLALGRPLALDGPARIALFHPVVGLDIVGTEVALVAGRPTDDTWMVLVALHHALRAVHVLSEPVGDERRVA